MTDSFRTADADAFDALAEEFLVRLRRGEEVSAGEYAQRHPALAAEIEELFPFLVRMEQLGVDGPDSPDPLPPSAPERIGDYLIHREVGRGGMGVVYEAEQQSLARRVALKVLPSTAALSATSRERFGREARSAARLHHTNIVPVFEVGSADGFEYYAMQLIRGCGLNQIIDCLCDLRGVDDKSSRAGAAEAKALWSAHSLVTGRLENPESRLLDQTAPNASASDPSPSSQRVLTPSGSTKISSSGEARRYFRTVARIGRAVADALQYAHSRGVIHRDIKPSNLLLEAGGEVWVTDFGLAKTDEVDLTETGAVVGTLRYMAPERFDGECDGGADVYALGATLYELITLRPAFGGTDRMQIIENIRSAEPVSLRSIDGRIPADLEIIVQKALAKEPSRRYPTAQAMAEDLGRFIEDRPIRARRVSATQRLVRWSRRNRALATSLVGVFALLIAVTAVSAIGQRRERNQRENLERELYQSQMRLAGIASGSVLGLHEVDRITANLQQYPALHGWEWFHLDALARQHQLKLQLGEGTHGGRIGWSPNGKYLFASDPQGDVHVIDFASGEVVERFADHETHVMSISTSPDGSLLVTASLDGVIQIRDAVSWERRARFVVLEEKGQLFGVDVHPDSTMIFAHLNGLRSRIYRIAGSGGTLVRELSEVTGGGSFSPDGRYLATQVKARMDRDADSRGWIPSATVWDAESFTRIATCFAPVVDVPKSPRWNADGSSIAWGSLEGPLVWTDWTATTDARLLEFTRNQHGPRPAAERISWSPDGQSFATAARDGIVRIWDPRAGTDWRQFSGNGDVLSDVSWQPAGTIVATLSRDLQVRAWDTAVGSPVQDFEFPYRSVGYLAWSPDSRKLLRGPSRRHVVDVETEEITPFPHGAPIWIGNRFLGMRGLLPGAAPAVQRIVSEFLPGETLHKISGVPGHGVFMTTREGRLLRQDELLQSPPVEIATGIEWLHYAMTVAADGSRVAVGLYRDVCCYDGHTGAVLFNVPMLTKTDVLDFDPNSRWLAAVGERPEVRLLDARTGELHVELIGHLIAPRAVEFHPDGSRIATGGNDGTVRLWDPETGDLITIFEEGSEVHAVAWSPDGRRLATQLDDGSVRVRDARDYPIHRRRR